MSTPGGEGLRRFQAGIPEQSPLNIAVLDAELRIMWVNAALARLCEAPRGRWVGRRLAEMLPGLEVEEVEPMLRHVLETGDRVMDVERRGPRFRASQSERVWSCSGFRLEDAESGVIGAALIASDVTKRSQDRERLALLNEASERIGSTLDIVRTAEETLDVLVPRVADLANVNLLSYVLDGGPQPRFEPGSDDLRMEIAATRWPPGRTVPEPLRTGSLSYLDSKSRYFRWLSEGRPILAPQLSALSAEFREMLLSDFFNRRLEAVREAGAHSAMILPIAARGVILGTVAMFRMRQPGFTAQEFSLARDVLARSALCLDNARVYSRERSTALELQRSMLPQSIGSTPGLELAYRYEPANTASEIGGDWFDVVPHPDGCVALIIGDVTGHDIHAASLMGQLRTATRTLATLDLSPAEVLTRLDAITTEMSSEVGATCVYVAYNPATRRCVIARAGHPPPALVRPGGGVEFLDLPAGVPLGVGGEPFESVELELERGSVLVLYTDGLIESRDAPIDVGMDELAQALADSLTEPFGSGYASALITRLVPDPSDDIAVLLARITD
jgi:PAS domain S-box-containing protein